MDARGSVHVEAAGGSFLCLKCRNVGHIVNECPLSTWPKEHEWLFSLTRRRMRFRDVSSSSQQELCSRCQDLDVIGLLHEEIPWKSSFDLNQAAEKGSNLFRSLGTTGSIQFKHDCPLCCCLFAMTPNPSSPAQEVLVFSDWTMNRLSGDGGTDFDTKEKLQYAKCLLIALRPCQARAAFSITAHSGDALCIMEGDDADYATTLGGRLIESSSLNTGLIEEWLSTCLRLHGRDCTPVYTEDLQGIRLIDVFEPRRVINYPYIGCEYVALSYVWGGVAQKSFRQGSTLSRLPQTIEDAMACVRSLGKRYLWVDSVCIDQLDEKEKRDQIGRMSSIYRGAYITLIALSCCSAETGLPRFASRMPLCSQLRCRIGGKRLVGLMPTLSQPSFWGSRAWTLQEALLSPRCLYLSDYQLYFECNVMQCCESLDQTKSWAHNLACDSNPSQQGSVSWMIAQHGHGYLKNEIGPSSERFVYWGNMVNVYSRRKMSKAEDALNAFSGVLQCLETKYEDGFFWGLPVADFQWGLLWRFQSRPTRREGFPTWSWAGWKAMIWADYALNITTDKFPVQLQIWKVVEEQLVKVFRTSQAAAEGSTDVGSPFRSDPTSTAETYDLQSPEFDLSQYPRAEHNGYLFVEAIVLHFIPDYSLPLPKITRYPFFEYFNFYIGVTRCRIEIKSIDREINGPVGCTEQQFLLLARGGLNNEIWHHLLLVHPRGNLVERGTAIILIVPQDRLEVLRHLKPQKRRVVLS
ncbi:hypothetical protein JMJ35_006540 [Cladonia borealis]|uniref:CCHC-type domain-containing protein n=1 Tax=Cladonia borealis TaxID=184061 RepID=A0AA39V0D5_9LECA|nr:hypothetical protein JMJ35_006540 [Cladonia borealis]